MTNEQKFIQIMNETFNAGLTVENLRQSMTPCSPCGVFKQGACTDFSCEGCAKWWEMEYKEPERDPIPDVLMFIGRFSTDGQRTRREVVECFTRGCCYWFAYILDKRFSRQYSTEIMVDYVNAHFGCRIGGRVYDITGDVTERYRWEPWRECKDAALIQSITEYCVMF